MENSIFRAGDEQVIRQMLGLADSDDVPLSIQSLYRRYSILRDRVNAADAPAYLLALLVTFAEASDGSLDLTYAGPDPTEMKKSDADE